MSEGEDDIMSAFDSAFAVDASLKTSAKPKNRKAAEKKHGLRHDDGRRLNATGRTAQFNIKTKPDYVDRIKAAAKKHDVMLAQLAEYAFDWLLQQLAANPGKVIREIAATEKKR